MKKVIVGGDEEMTADVKCPYCGKPHRFDPCTDSFDDCDTGVTFHGEGAMTVEIGLYFCRKCGGVVGITVLDEMGETVYSPMED